MAVISETCGEDTSVLRVVGDVTIESVPIVDLRVRRVCRSDPGALLVDLTGVSFFGAAGLTLLLDIHRRTQLADTTLLLVAPSHIVRLLRITGLEPVFQIHDTVRHAVAADDGRCVADPALDHLKASPPAGTAVRRRSIRLVPD
ncbi:STAS domain-containing protein [Kibdelosporangium phytohabitans]|uniref:STAS domain-containing protein n=1 Tax=Kibdelosporangium phytohabitans TaxID=860235 RepID=A0A0N9HYM6_9PSEU|nr:STAS domain-containing protein [Kibdelosporangium phytohabitans]ALG06985.1 hypothetical protein AOZ06_08650 [Kibdelosporangium phytohabitans]MBE1468270.1 anti-anti-sigma factor [Kibdelosporangium phytohabitans]